MADPTLNAQAGPLPAEALEGVQVGEYVVERVIGSGGMGVVYSAQQPQLSRRVAIKVLKPQYASDPTEAERFRREALAISKIRHRGIVEVHTLGHLADGRLYMVMELLEGETLATALHREAPMAQARALPILVEVLEALSAAHEAGVIHRDLKPANVFLAQQSNGTHSVKLMDFGLAYQVDRTVKPGRTWTMAGTPEYLSPEQAAGRPVSPGTDLYAVGAMAFEMLSGGLPFGGQAPQDFIQAHLSAAAPRLSAFVAVPAALETLVAELLEKDPARRPASAAVVARALSQLLEANAQRRTESDLPLGPHSATANVLLESTVPRGAALPAQSPPSSPSPQSDGATRWPVGAGVIGVATLAGAAIAGLIFFSRPEPHAAQPAQLAPAPVAVPSPPATAVPERLAAPPQKVDLARVQAELDELARQETAERGFQRARAPEADLPSAEGSATVPVCDGRWRKETLRQVERVEARKRQALRQGRPEDGEDMAGVKAHADLLRASVLQTRTATDCKSSRQLLGSWISQ